MVYRKDEIKWWFTSIYKKKQALTTNAWTYWAICATAVQLSLLGARSACSDMPAADSSLEEPLSLPLPRDESPPPSGSFSTCCLTRRFCRNDVLMRLFIRSWKYSQIKNNFNFIFKKYHTWAGYHIKLKADQLCPWDYPPKPPDYRHTEKFIGPVMTILVGRTVQPWECRRMDGWTDVR